MAFGGTPSYEGAYVEVPDMVKQFVVYFYRHIRERNIREIFSMYEVSFAKLTDRFFKGTTWPPVEAIADLVDHDHVFCLLYKEMYYRHLYATVQPSLQQRCDSWENYCALFGVILHGNVNMQLPNGWLWDMVDEFIYQFQSWCQFRGKLAARSAEDATALRACDAVWNVLGVLNYLQALADKSKIGAELTAPGGLERFHETEGYGISTSNVLRMLGYFSLVGLLRVHVLIGDYLGGLKALAPIHPFQLKYLYTPKIVGCHITLFYYAGFAYMMLRRYLDAARAFNTVLTYIVRVKAAHQRSAQYDQILKKNEQMYALSAITLALCPAAARQLDETILTALREKYGEKMQRMARAGGEPTYDELFSYSCPKFITAALPGGDNGAVPQGASQEAYRLQLRCFLGLVHEQRHLPSLKQFMQLYTSISLPKLAGLMEMDEAATRAQLMLLKAASRCVTWSGAGDATAGAAQAAADVDFYIDIDAASGLEMVHVADVKPVRRQGEFLAKHIGRFEEIIRDLSYLSVQPQQAPPAAAVHRAAAAAY